jgi:uncharacterized paraquat-inducible protein A
MTFPTCNECKAGVHSRAASCSVCGAKLVQSTSHARLSTAAKAWAIAVLTLWCLLVAYAGSPIIAAAIGVIGAALLLRIASARLHLPGMHRRTGFRMTSPR